LLFYTKYDFPTELLLLYCYSYIVEACICQVFIKQTCVCVSVIDADVDISRPTPTVHGWTFC